jgi:transcriptional antiterminator RfaH
MKRWYVVQTRTHAERRALEHLGNQGFEAWLPEYMKRRRHARRTDWVRRPLFPNYLFVHLDLEAERWRSVLGTVGVVGLVGGNLAPTPLPDQVIATIRARVDGDGLVAMDSAASFKPGDAVKVAEGPFADLEGIFVDLADRDRVAILLRLLGREVKVTVRADQLERT